RAWVQYQGETAFDVRADGQPNLARDVQTAGRTAGARDACDRTRQPGGGRPEVCGTRTTAPARELVAGETGHGGRVRAGNGREDGPAGRRGKRQRIPCPGPGF